MAQPVPVRPVPQQPWGRILAFVLVLLALLLAAWEGYWRAYGVTPSISNSNGLWAMQRRRIDQGEGAATVLVGDSRLFFDLRLPVWAQLDGERPIQLSLEGTSARWTLEDLAADPRFSGGRLLIGVAPDVFFSGFPSRAEAIRYARKETPAQRVGQWLAMHLIEPYLAFDDPDYALATVLARQPWPERTARRLPVRKLAMTENDRNSYLWSKVEQDQAYRDIARGIWLNHMQRLPGDPPAREDLKNARQQITKVAAAVATLRARGVQVLFVRLPSNGPYLAYENRKYPRALTWDVLLKESGAPGIHFEDYPELQGYDIPEWSHLSYRDSERFTAALQGIVQRKFWGPAAPHPVPQQGP
ncbi:MAG: hypothetical protein JOZ03_06955 [Gammaproteobacteria bacterium]|nr:hypothetical protein [Gammaproteobacteria bacterium]